VPPVRSSCSRLRTRTHLRYASDITGLLAAARIGSNVHELHAVRQWRHALHLDGAGTASDLYDLLSLRERRHALHDPVVTGSYRGGEKSGPSARGMLT
jgi:hypothetical protein